MSLFWFKYFYLIFEIQETATSLWLTSTFILTKKFSDFVLFSFPLHFSVTRNALLLPQLIKSFQLNRFYYDLRTWSFETKKVSYKTRHERLKDGK